MGVVRDGMRRGGFHNLISELGALLVAVVE